MRGKKSSGREERCRMRCGDRREMTRGQSFCPLQLDSEMGGRVGQNKDKLEPRMVDAYWLQRETNKFMNDPLVSKPAL